MPLVLFSRQGCCLCLGLEERLHALGSGMALEVIDVDGDAALQARYGLTVPVLALREPTGLRELPPVPPRLQSEALRRWLGRQGVHC